MNKKGNVFLNLVLGIFIFISGVLIYPYITDDITTTRALLNCENFAGLSNGTIIQCLITSGIAPYFIWFFISIALGFIIGGLKDE